MTIRPIAFTGAMVSALLSGRKTQTRRVLADVPPAPNKNCHPSHKQIHDAPYIDSYCSKRRTDENPRGMSDRWCWWQVDDRQCPPTFRVPFVPGDLLYVRERHYADMVSPNGKCARILYSADGRVSVNIDWPSRCRLPIVGQNRPPMFLPREFSRLTLKVTDVRVERVKQISEADARAEGLAAISKDGKLFKFGIPDRDGYPGNDDYGWHWPDWEVDPRAAFRTLWDSINAPRGFGWDANPWVCCIEFSVHRGNVADLIESEAEPPQQQGQDNE